MTIPQRLTAIAAELTVTNPGQSFYATDACVFVVAADGVDYAVYAATVLDTIVCMIRGDGRIETSIYHKREVAR